MADETKDIVTKNIDARATKDVAQFKRDLHALLIKNLDSRRDSDSYFYGSNELIIGKPSEIVEKFVEEIAPYVKNYHTKEKEKQFSEILTNLASYLEMINH